MEAAKAAYCQKTNDYDGLHKFWDVGVIGSQGESTLGDVPKLSTSQPEKEDSLIHSGLFFIF